MLLADLIETHGVDVLDHLDRQVEVPVHTGLQFQGDVAVVPAALAGRELRPATTPIPAAGVPVVRGENGGNTHLLLAEGPVTFDPSDPRQPADRLPLGTLTIPDGATAWLAHPEHAYTGIGAGTYELRRQREQRERIELVAD